MDLVPWFSIRPPLSFLTDLSIRGDFWEKELAGILSCTFMVHLFFFSEETEKEPENEMASVKLGCSQLSKGTLLSSVPSFWYLKSTSEAIFRALAEKHQLPLPLLSPNVGPR